MMAQGGGWEYPTVVLRAGMVSVEGRMLNGQGGMWSGMQLGTIPTGYRPRYAHSFATRISGGTGEVKVQNDGQLILDAWSGGDPGAAVFLSGINYNQEY
jgi:hypothetical protein